MASPLHSSTRAAGGADPSARGVCYGPFPLTARLNPSVGEERRGTFLRPCPGRNYRRSTINNQQSTINDQRSTINSTRPNLENPGTRDQYVTWADGIRDAPWTSGCLVARNRFMATTPAVTRTSTLRVGAPLWCAINWARSFRHGDPPRRMLRMFKPVTFRLQRQNMTNRDGNIFLDGSMEFNPNDRRGHRSNGRLVTCFI